MNLASDVVPREDLSHTVPIQWDGEPPDTNTKEETPDESKEEKEFTNPVFVIGFFKYDDTTSDESYLSRNYFKIRGWDPKKQMGISSYAEVGEAKEQYNIIKPQLPDDFKLDKANDCKEIASQPLANSS